ncbi:797_t:CDS:2 [Acaulospora morrowiae]|uniref:797_t:CDS:1 n=1 Tax=Acaulospora morrowiae TaxID=94023 RepID=A0A9N9EN69_9GLOM|nr:797_t:CDS:2 [Acaulospora morrowiae]
MGTIYPCVANAQTFPREPCHGLGSASDPVPALTTTIEDIPYTINILSDERLNNQGKLAQTIIKEDYIMHYDTFSSLIIGEVNILRDESDETEEFPI